MRLCETSGDMRTRSVSSQHAVPLREWGQAVLPGCSLGELVHLAEDEFIPGADLRDGGWYVDPAWRADAVQVVEGTEDDRLRRATHEQRMRLLGEALEQLGLMRALIASHPHQDPIVQRLRQDFCDFWSRRAATHLGRLDAEDLAEVESLRRFCVGLGESLCLPAEIPWWLEFSRLYLEHRRRRHRARTSELEVRLARKDLEAAQRCGEETSLFVAVVAALEREGDSRRAKGSGEAMSVVAAVSRHLRGEGKRRRVKDAERKGAGGGRPLDHTARRLYRGLGDLWLMLSGRKPAVRSARPRGRDWRFLSGCVSHLRDRGCPDITTYDLARREFNFRRAHDVDLLQQSDR